MSAGAPMTQAQRVRAFADHASCVGHERLFTSDGRDIEDDALLAMKRICAQCPVLWLCEEYAQAIQPVVGMWAGKLRTRPRYEAPAPMA